MAEWAAEGSPSDCVDPVHVRASSYLQGVCFLKQSFVGTAVDKLHNCHVSSYRLASACIAHMASIHVEHGKTTLTAALTMTSRRLTASRKLSCVMAVVELKLRVPRVNCCRALIQ